jgi:RNA polymerase sigma-70 factor, ECF subfamily
MSSRGKLAMGGFNHGGNAHRDGNARPGPGLRCYEAKGASVDAPDGDRGDGFPEAFGRYAPAILGYARRRLESQEAGWDVVSDTFTAAWRHWDRRPGPDELLPWLYAIAGNSVRDQRRSAERRRRLVARLAAVRRDRHAADPAEGVVLGRSIGDALSRLPAADREVLRLVAWEGQTDARSLGLVLGVSPAAARSRVHRARRRLRALLDEAGNPAPGVAGPRTGTPVRPHAREV